jgi:hypothetical protein
MRLARFACLALLGTIATPRSLGSVATTGEFAVRFRNLIFSGPVTTLTVLPGETVTLEAIHDTVAAATARSTAGRLTQRGNGRWSWTAPNVPGLYPISISAGGDSLRIQAFVLVPFDRVRQERINGYRIGRYTRRTPAGFIEVTRANQDAFVSPHFRLKQFVCKQAGGYPKYIVLDERLLQKLEALLALANTSGYQASTFHVMSGYRTPAYNHALGNVPFSRHTWGAAADIFIDENSDGRMDDLNGDGRSDVADATVLYNLFDSRGKVAGMGKYAPTRAHGAFVHVDVRDRTARW